MMQPSGSSGGRDSRLPSVGASMREERDVAAGKRPSFLKRQKEQQRLARALEKREARQARRQAKAAGVAEAGAESIAEGEAPESPVELEQPVAGEDAER